jgi:hypothetical protein
MKALLVGVLAIGAGLVSMAKKMLISAMKLDFLIRN